MNVSLPICLLQANGQPEPAAAPTFFDIISGDEDTTLRSIVQITNGVTGIVDKVQILLVYWEKKYKHMWDQDKDAYIRYENICYRQQCIMHALQGYAETFCRDKAALQCHADCRA